MWILSTKIVRGKMVWQTHTRANDMFGVGWRWWWDDVIQSESAKFGVGGVEKHVTFFQL